MPSTKNNTKKRKRKEDRIGDLPDSILIHILSFLNLKTIVRTCILSKRWKDLWKQIPNLILHSLDFSNAKNFTKFVHKVLSLRDNSLALHILDLDQDYECMSRPALEKVLSYAASHSVQSLRINGGCSIKQVPGTIFSCRTLTSLKLSLDYLNGFTPFPKSVDLPALTSLQLECFAFCAANGNDDRVEPFSGCKRLSHLVIKYWTLKDSAKILCMSSTTLSSLTVLFPRSEGDYAIMLSAPNLRSFAFKGAPLYLSGSNLSCVEQVHIVAYPYAGVSKSRSILLNWLQGLTNVQSLTLSANTLQVLFSIPGLLKIKLLSLANLKALKVKMRKKQRKPNTRIVKFLLQNSPSAEVVYVK